MSQQITNPLRLPAGRYIVKKKGRQCNPLSTTVDSSLPELRLTVIMEGGVLSIRRVQSIGVTTVGKPHLAHHESTPRTTGETCKPLTDWISINYRRACLDCHSRVG